MGKEVIGIIGQYGCMLLMFTGLSYEIASGANLGWIILTGGAIGAAIFVKIRGK